MLFIQGIAPLTISCITWEIWTWIYWKQTLGWISECWTFKILFFTELICILQAFPETWKFILNPPNYFPSVSKPIIWWAWTFMDENVTWTTPSPSQRPIVPPTSDRKVLSEGPRNFVLVTFANNWHYLEFTFVKTTKTKQKKTKKIAKAGPVDKGCQRLQKTHIELVIPNGIPHWWLSTAWSFNQQLKKTIPELVAQCLEKGQKCQIVATRTLYLKTN